MHLSAHEAVNCVRTGEGELKRRRAAPTFLREPITPQVNTFVVIYVAFIGSLDPNMFEGDTGRWESLPIERASEHPT